MMENYKYDECCVKARVLEEHVWADHALAVGLLAGPEHILQAARSM